MSGRKRQRPEAWRAQRKRAAGRQLPIPMFTCPDCGKQTYRSRKLADESARRLYPGDALSAYLCRTSPESEQRWHIGHLPPSVVRGRRSRDQLQPKQPRALES